MSQYQTERKIHAKCFVFLGDLERFERAEKERPVTFISRLFLNLVFGEMWTLLGKPWQGAPARCQKGSPRLSLEGSSWELAGKGELPPSLQSQV